MKKNCRKLRPLIKISREHQTNVSFRGVLISISVTISNVFLNIGFWEFVCQKIIQEVLISSILPAPMTRFLSEVLWQTQGRKHSHKRRNSVGKGRNIYLKLRIRYFSHSLLLCYVQYWISQNYIVWRESILGSIWRSTQGSPLGSIRWVHIFFLPEKTRCFIVVTMEPELRNTYSLPSYLM